MKPTILIIHGAMACGKSTITKKLENELDNFHFIDRAHIKNIMLTKLKERQLAKDLSKKAVYLIMKGLMKYRKHILLQEQRSPSIKKYLKDFIKKYRYRVISIYLECSVKSAKKRDLNRQKRHIRPDIVEEMHQKHAYPDKGDIIINTEKNSISKVIKKILIELEE